VNKKKQKNFVDLVFACASATVNGCSTGMCHDSPQASAPPPAPGEYSNFGKQMLFFLAPLVIQPEGPGEAVDAIEAENDIRQITTVIGRMKDLERFSDDPAIDTWAKSGRIPKPVDPPVTWAENRAWLDARIARGDKFGIASDPATLPPVRGGYIAGQPNGYFTARELQYLQDQGITPAPMH